MTLLGQFALWAAFLLSLWTAAVGFSGAWRGRPDLTRSVGRGVTGILVALLVASAALWYGIVTHDFNIEYVAGYTSRNLPGPYLVSAFWAGQKGSLLLWATVLAVYAALAQALTPRRHAPLLPYVAAVTSTTSAFFIAVMLFGDSPFARLPFTPPPLSNHGGAIASGLVSPGAVAWQRLQLAWRRSAPRASGETSAAGAAAGHRTATASRVRAVLMRFS